MKKPVRPVFKSSIRAVKPHKPAEQIKYYNIYDQIPIISDKIFVSEECQLWSNGEEYYPMGYYKSDCFIPIEEVINIFKDLKKNNENILILSEQICAKIMPDKQKADKYNKELKEYELKRRPDTDKYKAALKKYKTELAEYELYMAKKKYEKAMEKDI